MTYRKKGEGMVPARYWDPFSMLREMERAFDSFRMGLPDVMPPESRMARVDIRDEGDRYVLEAELPGMTKEDVDIEIGDGVLQLRARKERAEEERKEGYLRQERGYASFYRRLSLPDDADEEKVTARLDNGVLVVTLAKREGAPEGRRRIDIE